MYLVLGIESFKMAQVWGTHSNKQIAEQQAKQLEKNKSALCCQRYEAITTTEAKKRKYNLFA